ncbi:MAG: hypothetical protein BWY59_01697 [Verrucomicrobia bacterium ADurb.Bin345]|nr:MAG: hypothetical protein BWY59_01697 [Verrucomicrobia bacterium ADurb.Bin345]
MGAHLFREQAGNDVVLVVVHGRHERRLLHTRVLERFPVERVALDHERPVQPLRAFMRPLLAQLDQDGFLVGAFQELREPQAQVAAARDDHLVRHRPLRPGPFEEARNVLAAADEIGVVADEELRIAARDDQVISPHDADETDETQDLLVGKRPQRRTQERAVHVNPDAHGEHIPVEQVHGLERARHAEDVEELARAFLLLADDEVNTDALEIELFRRGQEVAVRYARDLVRHARDMRDHAGENVGFIAVRDRHDEVGLGDFRLVEHDGAGALALDGQDIELGLDLRQSVGIAVNQHDVALLRTQLGRKVSARVACAYDKYSHDLSNGYLCYCRVPELPCTTHALWRARLRCRSGLQTAFL